jgi:DNA polymerase
MKLTIDFETRSIVDLKKHGAWVYSEHPTTEILCLACKWEGQPAWIVTPKETEKIKATMNAIAQATTIEAHNVQFEYALWVNVGVKKYGWPPLSLEKLRCSAAKSSMHSLPRALGNACAALGLAQQKDDFGYRIMMKLCKPRKPRMGEPEGLYWNEDPIDLDMLYRYCMQDVIAEEALSKVLRDLPVQELKIWQLDQVINARGVQVDLPGARKMLEMVAEHEGKLLRKLTKLTYGNVRTAKQVEQLRGYLRGLGTDLPDLTAATVKNALKGELNETVRELLEIRRSLGRSSSAKYTSIVDRASADSRVRGTLLYHGASTGRWSGSGIQPQNFPSRIKVSAPVEEMLKVVNLGGLALHNALYDDDPMSTAGALTRSVLVAAEGKDLVVADYSAIEGRGLAWLAGEESELEIYRSGKDVYIASAAHILHKSYDQVTAEERQSPGKVSVLACGYGGSAGAARKFGGDLAFRPRWEATGLKGKALEDKIDEDIVSSIIKPWREAHPRTTAFWYDLERACMSAVQEPGKIFTNRGVSFTVRDRFLMCRLPSGRLLFYYDPDIMPVVTSWGDTKDSVTYMTVHSMTKKWVRTNTYGGKICENICQGICRDIMAEAMLRVEAAGYSIVLTVHDEIVCEVPEGFGSVPELESLMSEVPAWATGFPISAVGWRGKRYKKG